MQITAKTALQVAKLYQSYTELRVYEQSVLKLLAVIYRPIGISKFNHLLTAAKNAQVFTATVDIKALTPEHKNNLVSQSFIHHSKEGIVLNALLASRIIDDCVTEQSYLSLVNFVERNLPSRTKYDWQRDLWDNQSIVRHLYFLADFNKLELALNINKNPQNIDVKMNRSLIEVCLLDFQLERFLLLPDAVQYQVFAAAFHVLNQQGENSDYLFELIKKVWLKNSTNKNLANLFSEMALYRLQFDDCLSALTLDSSSCYGLQVHASLAFLQGNYAASKTLFDQAMAAKNKFSRRKNQYLGGQLGIFYKFLLLVLASQNSATFYDDIRTQIDSEYRDKNVVVEFRYVLEALLMLVNSLSLGNKYSLRIDNYDYLIRFDRFNYHHILLINLLAEIWCNGALSKQQQSHLNQCHSFFDDLNLTLFVAVAEQITLWQKSHDAPKSGGLINFPTLVSRKAEWDIALEKLIALNPQLKTTSESNKSSEKPIRLIWEAVIGRHQASFKAREQKQTASGWTKGRPVALKRLLEETATFTYLSDADKKMCQAIIAYQNWGYYNSTEYELAGAKALIAAKDLDNVFLAHDLTAPIEFIQKEPELLVSQQGQQLLLSIADLPLHIDKNDDVGAFSIKEHSAERYTFTLFTASHLKVAEIIGEGGLLIPLHAKAKVLESVAAIAPLLNIQSDIDELDTGLETVVCDNHLVINIQPIAAGLEFICVVMPFGEQGPAFKPTVGNANLTAELDGKRIATQRDLMQESVLLDLLDNHCPQFLAMTDNTLSIDELQPALETLEQLEQVISQTPIPFAVRLRWPKGKKFTLTKRLESQHLQLAVGKKSEWFDLTGELVVNNDQVIELRKLLELISASNGRFVQLDAGQVLALSQDLRQKLEQISQVTDDGKFHALASLQVAEATTGMRMKTLHAWEQQSKKMYEANTIDPVVPATLQANLRDYQLVGFDWMSRLAHWGAGACLADDMGLGKTLQALAILLARAPKGPSLVIAPTSVCFNWQQEAVKFAPTLNIQLFSDSTNTEQRSNLLTNLKPFDCVILSYGLLQRESELLATVKWHTIVADEAQALKNPLAKRTQAACALKGDFKIITTGTPIENNLTELWSLFRFVNPGLLGNLKRFGQRYALPIENVKEDKLAARKASLGLKNLIQPFILRRMKSQVLTELPSRTEINIHVELSSKEQAFYEALRLNAIANISQSSKTLNTGEQRIRMLAELVKLRQACCNPKLVMAETDLPSAKLAALDELLDELQQNNHKALVFSQFVGHLQLIKQHLDTRKISYQYLDGSTPQKERAKRVNAFQAGEGDVFLISLKAGGSGLNLTAADYVIHMDPWWNPAVEEQASDRAHRMGQLRPVTIYRLIAKNTIEEKIVALHQHKRDLADNLLAGNEQATRLSVDDMLNMLKETF